MNNVAFIVIAILTLAAALAVASLPKLIHAALSLAFRLARAGSNSAVGLILFISLNIMTSCRFFSGCIQQLQDRCGAEIRLVRDL